MWSSIQQFVMGWSAGVFGLVFAILSICLLYCLLSFIKKAYGSKSKNKINWAVVVFAIILAALVAVLAAARWA